MHSRVAIALAALLAAAAAEACGGARCGLDVPQVCRALCDNGKDPASCARFAAMRERGHAVEKDLKDAVHYYARGCVLGYHPSCLLLGYKHMLGVGTAQNDARAAAAFHAACYLNSGDGCAMFGAMRRSSDVAEARSLFDRACALGSSIGCLWLGDELITLDPNTANTMYQRACHGGEFLGCTRLSGKSPAPNATPPTPSASAPPVDTAPLGN